MVKSKLTKYELYEENGRLFMRLVYENEDEHRIAETEILKVDTMIRTDYEPILEQSLYSYDEAVFMKCGDNTYPLYKVSNNYTLHRVIKEKPTEMTLEEIEKKLGYKIKIVSEKEKQNGSGKEM